MLQQPSRVVEQPNESKGDEIFVADKWSMANRDPTPEEMMSSERKKTTKLNKKKMGLGGFQSFEVTMQELRTQYQNQSNEIQYKVLTTIGRTKKQRIK